MGSLQEKKENRIVNGEQQARISFPSCFFFFFFFVPFFSGFFSPDYTRLSLFFLYPLESALLLLLLLVVVLVVKVIIVVVRHVSC